MLGPNLQTCYNIWYFDYLGSVKNVCKIMLLIYSQILLSTFLKIVIVYLNILYSCTKLRPDVFRTHCPISVVVLKLVPI